MEGDGGAFCFLRLAISWSLMTLMTAGFMIPGLVNIQKTMEKHHFLMGKSTISMGIFNSYVCLPVGN